MTNAPVKDIGSLMNFAGSSRTAAKSSTDPADCFGDVMSRASGGNAQSALQTQKTKEPTERADLHEKHSRVMKKDSSAVKTKETKTADEKELGKEAVTEAQKQAVKAVCEELDVSEEEVALVMEEMGISLMDLFDPSVLNRLVLELTGEQDPMVLLTEEGLFTKLQNLTETMGDLKQDLLQELDISPEELQTLLEELQAGKEQMEVTGQDALLQTEAVSEETPEITDQITENGETLQIGVDEKGNVLRTITVTGNSRQTTGEEQKGQNADAGEKHSSEFQKENPFLEGQLQNRTEIPKTPLEQTTFLNPNTQEIMDQILDYMKIQLRPGMDQLQMQLHPASLGTVQVQITSKGGEITAQFQVQNETVKAAVESQIVQLKEALNEQGVRVEAVEVAVQSNGFESNLWQGQEKGEDTGSQSSKKSPRRIDLANLDALFEEEAAPEDVLAAKMMEANGNTVDYTA